MVPREAVLIHVGVVGREEVVASLEQMSQKRSFLLAQRRAAQGRIVSEQPRHATRAQNPRDQRPFPDLLAAKPQLPAPLRVWPQPVSDLLEIAKGLDLPTERRCHRRA